MSEVTCRTAHEWILEKLDSTLAPRQCEALESHLAGCAECRRFEELQLQLDGALASRHSPALTHAFRANLKRRIKAEERRALWDAIPDLFHVGAGLAIIGICAWFLPLPASTVAAAGAVTYLSQALLRLCFEELEDI